MAAGSFESRLSNIEELCIIIIIIIFGGGRVPGHGPVGDRCGLVTHPAWRP